MNAGVKTLHTPKVHSTTRQLCFKLASYSDIHTPDINCIQCILRLRWPWSWHRYQTSPSGTGGSQSTTCTGPGMKEIESGSDGGWAISTGSECTQQPWAMKALWVSLYYMHCSWVCACLESCQSVRTGPNTDPWFVYLWLLSIHPEVSIGGVLINSW